LIEKIQRLLQLQEIDLQLHDAVLEVASFEPARTAAVSQRAAERAAIAVAEEVLSAAELRHRVLEGDLGAVEALLEKLNAQLYEVTSKTAFDALQSELSRSGSQKSDQEDRILELLDEVDTATATLDTARGAAEQGEAAGAEEEAARSKREQEMQAEITRLEALRVARAAEVDAATLSTYDRTRRKALPTVIFAPEKICPKCRMVISPQKLIDLRALAELVHCGSCDRILYGVKVAEAEGKTGVGA
jgi:predicted  nucleic acid-binding Zn-ribbon protein